MNVLEEFPQGVFVTNSASKAQTKVELGLQAIAVSQIYWDLFPCGCINENDVAILESWCCWHASGRLCFKM